MPLIDISPLSGSRKPVSIFIVVDLPAPFGPRKPTTSPLDTDKLMSSTAINWSTNENEVTDLYGTESINLSPGASVSSRAVVGHPLGALYGTGSKTNPDGSFDLNSNGFPQITSSPIVLGDPNPDWRGGISLSMRYKKLRLNAVLEPVSYTHLTLPTKA